jgi:hypothetical protein
MSALAFEGRSFKDSKIRRMKGLAKSKVGIVLVTPALLRRLRGKSIADKELSVLPSA